MPHSTSPLPAHKERCARPGAFPYCTCFRLPAIPNNVCGRHNHETSLCSVFTPPGLHQTNKATKQPESQRFQMAAARPNRRSRKTHPRVDVDALHHTGADLRRGQREEREESDKHLHVCERRRALSARCAVRWERSKLFDSIRSCIKLFDSIRSCIFGPPEYSELSLPPRMDLRDFTRVNV